MMTERKTNIILTLTGVFTILISLLVELYLMTFGLVVCIYSYELNKTTGPFFSLAIAVIAVFFFGKHGIGLLKRRPRSRIVIMSYWLIVSAAIVIFILCNIDDAFSEYAYNFGAWLGDTSFGLGVAVVGVLQFLFLKSKAAKELFADNAKP